MPKKMIQINPDFFKLGGKKTRNKHKKSKPDFRNTIKPNNLKKQLLMKIKSHQQKEKDKLSENSNKNVEEFQNDFNTSLNYLQTMIKQKKEKKRSKNKKTRKKRVNSNDTTQPVINTEPFGGENNVEKEPQLVNVSEIQPKDPPYGCLKNGTKPTYSQYMKTMKRSTRPSFKPKINIPSPTPQKTSDIIERQRKLKKLKERMATPKKEPIMKIVNKKRTIKIFKLGKKNGQVGVLIKSGKTRRKIRDEHGIIHKKCIADVKSYLRKHNLIKAGSSAPEKILRKMYEESFLAGDIYNNNVENLLHNYMQVDI